MTIRLVVAEISFSPFDTKLISAVTSLNTIKVYRDTILLQLLYTVNMRILGLHNNKLISIF